MSEHTQPDMQAAVVALQFAIQTEREGYRFYQEAASKTQDPQGKALFESLMQDELVHERILQARLEAVQRKGTWQAVVDSGEPLHRQSAEAVPIFSRERIREDVNQYTYELSALRMAYLIEKDAVAFYVRAAENAGDPDAQAMYNELADMERGHQRVLEQEYNFIADQFRLEMGFAPF